MNKSYDVWLFTNRNMLVLDSNGNQVPELQSAVTCYHIDAEQAKKAVEGGTRFYISKWKTWTEEISKLEMQYLLGLRTLEMDLAFFKRNEP